MNILSIIIINILSGVHVKSLFVILTYNRIGTAGSITNLRSKFLMGVLLKTSDDRSLLSFDAMLDNPQNDINSQRNLSSRTSAILEL
jgi:hypothetical protein